MANDASNSPQIDRYHSSEDQEPGLRVILEQLRRGAPRIIAFAFFGLFVGLVWCCLSTLLRPPSASTRVFFSFQGFENGEYPDHSKFQPDDIRAPAVIEEALQHLGLNTSSDFQAKVRGGLSIEAIIPAAITRERDKMRALGQNPPPYVADEYVLTLTFRAFSIDPKARQQLLNEIVSAFSGQFQRTYTKLPQGLGNAFTTLESADFAEYQLVLDKEIESITNYLNALIVDSHSFRSRRTNLTFNDLLEQTEMFSQISLNETLGLIYQNGLSRNRKTAMLKMDYYLRIVGEQEQHALEDANVVNELLQKSDSRAQGYVLGIKSQVEKEHSDAPVVDQGLINSLLRNDSHNFLIHQALDAENRLGQIRAEKARLAALRENMKSFVNRESEDQTQTVKQVEHSLAELKGSYDKLIALIRATYEDFAAQQYGNAIRVSDEVKSSDWLRSAIEDTIAGILAGLSLGCGLALVCPRDGKTR